MRVQKGWINDLAISADSPTIAASSGKIVKLRNMETRAELRSLCGHSDVVNVVAFTPNGDMLASGSDDQTIRLWHVDSGEERGILWVRSRPINSVAFSPDGTLLGIGSMHRRVDSWSSHTHEQLYTLCSMPSIRWLKLLANNRILTTNRGAKTLPLLTPIAAAAAAAVAPLDPS
jgi:WD40 repeat protein